MPYRKRTAFTLVELLVVIGIIALLISILLPALGRARQAAYTASCLSNLHQLSVAAQMYSSNNNGYNLPAAYYDMWNGTRSARVSHDTWAEILTYGGYLGTPPAAQFYQYWSIVNVGVLRCPAGSDADSLFFTGTNLPWFPSPASFEDLRGTYPHFDYYTAGGSHMAGGSQPGNYYVANHYGFNAVNGNGYGVDITQWPSRQIPYGGTASTPDNDPSLDWSLPKRSQVRKAGEVVFCFDGIADGQTYHSLTNSPFYFANARHNNRKMCNVAFYDGHAQTLPCSTNGTNVFPKPSFSYGYGSSDFTAATLSANHPFPKWRLDQ